MAYDEKGIVRISDSSLWLLIPPELRKMTQRHQIMCDFTICIQDGTYWEYINHWLKRRLRYINNHSNSLTRLSVEQFNAEIFFPVMVMLYYLMENRLFRVPKMMHFPVCVNFLTKISNFPKWSCVLNWWSECPGSFYLCRN